MSHMWWVLSDIWPFPSKNIFISWCCDIIQYDFNCFYTTFWPWCGFISNIFLRYMTFLVKNMTLLVWYQTSLVWYYIFWVWYHTFLAWYRTISDMRWINNLFKMKYMLYTQFIYIFYGRSHLVYIIVNFNHCYCSEESLPFMALSWLTPSNMAQIFQE